MKVNVVSRDLIKPCTPTPQNLTKYKISFIDELAPQRNVSLILFYEPNPSPKQSIIHLRESLAKILPQFYPLAGRYIKRDYLVDCNDEGAEFLEAEVLDDIKLVDFIANTTRNYDDLYDLVSREAHHQDLATDPLLSIQVTEFKCGGLAIALSVSHRISDMSSVATFLAAWSNITNNCAPSSASIVPDFDCARSLFPGKNVPSDCVKPPTDIVFRRLVFNKEAISSLRSKLREPKNARGYFVSRVRLVTAVITMGLIRVEIARYGKSQVRYITHLIDIRGRINPPLPKHSYGNFVTVSSAELGMDENGTLGFQEIVDLVGDSIDKTIEECGNILSKDEDEQNEMVMREIMKLLEIYKYREGSRTLGFTDRSKCGFYETDFGWGKPVWLGPGAPGIIPDQNLCTVLVDNKEGGGMEAWVSVHQDDVTYFDQDEELKLFSVA